jgi:hypothetical protein
MSSPDKVALQDRVQPDALREACALIGAVETSAGLDDGDIQALLAAAVRLYAERAAQHDEPLPAFDATRGRVTATDAMLATTAILKAVNVATFELGMWQAWTKG